MFVVADLGQPKEDSDDRMLGDGFMKESKFIKVLVADDSSLLRGHLMDVVSRFQEMRVVGQAEDVPQAIESVFRLNPDLVILDIQMPGGTGIDVLETIKANKPSPVVIMLTNYPYPQYRKKCIEAGADFFFDKSLDFNALIDTLRNLILRFGYSLS
jgi:DNA-binding NarL/FixJ family response regulator